MSVRATPSLAFTAYSCGTPKIERMPLPVRSRTVRHAAGALALAGLVLVGCARPSHVPATATMRFGQLQASTTHSSGASARLFSAVLPAEVSSVLLRFPQNSIPGQPLRVLVALHGIGGSGETFARDLTAAADQNSWVLVAPTIAYGDWMDPVQVAHEDTALIDLAVWLSCTAPDSDGPADRLWRPAARLLARRPARTSVCRGVPGAGCGCRGTVSGLLHVTRGDLR
jgi:hypothetical protein